MRVDLTKAVSVGDGDTVVITCRLPRSQNDARLSVWSGAHGFELSPHVFTAQLRMQDTDGRPAMLRPLSMRLDEHHRTHKIEFVADEELDIVVKQEIDVAGDPVAKAKVKRYGKATASVRRFLRDAYRALRDRTARTVRSA